MKWRNQLLALFCLLVFFAFGVFYFRYWVVQKPFGIILFVAEGLDPGRLAATRIYKEGADTSLTLDSLPYTALLKNYSKDFATPDQAAAATAISTGEKVKNGLIGIDSEGKALLNLLELAQQSGRMTGLVSDVMLTDVTAASFYAHSSAKENRETLTRALLGAEIDVVLGGGAADFLPVEKGGRRSDDRDMLLELQETGYDLVQSRDELEEVPRWRRAKLFGLFASQELAFTDEEENRGDQPKLADMVRRAIELLQFNRGGYLLVVDAGLMRKSARVNDGERTLLETAELDHAVGVALEYAGAKSAIIVCGDVGIGGLEVNGFPPLEGKGIASFREDGASGMSLTWATGPGAPEPPEMPAPVLPPDAADSMIEPSPLPSPRAAAAVAKNAASAENTAADLVAFGSGLGTDALHGTLESTAIFEIIRDNL